MLTEDDAGGWQPPPWMVNDFSAWRVGWAQEKKTGMAEALVEGKRRAKSKPENWDPPGAELQLVRFESEREE
jgi:hypothetical protein